MNQQENREIRISPDALIALVVAEAEDRELSAMPSLEEMNAAFHPSEEFQKKMDRLLKQAKRKQERKGAWRATKRLFVVATTVVTAFACILMPVQAVQEAVVSTVLNWRDQFVEILYSKEDDPNAVILLQNVELTYLPEGFTETPSNRTSNTSFWNEYQSENGEWLTVRILPIPPPRSRTGPAGKDEADSCGTSAYPGHSWSAADPPRFESYTRWARPGCGFPALMQPASAGSSCR